MSMNRRLGLFPRRTGATAAAASAAGFWLSIGTIADLVALSLQLRCGQPAQLLGDDAVAMHAAPDFVAALIEGDVREHRLGARLASRGWERGGIWDGLSHRPYCSIINWRMHRPGEGLASVSDRMRFGERHEHARELL